MGIVQTAITRLITASVADLTAQQAAALAALTDRVAAVEDRPLSAEDRAALDAAAQMVAEFEAIAEGTIESVTVPDIK